METLVLVTLIVTSGLLAGFFFAYWCSVMIGMRKVTDAAFVETMQEINGSLPNARFAVPFFAPVVLAPVATWLAFSDGNTSSGWWCVAATALSLLTFAITGARNVPMNNALAAAGRDHDSAARSDFEQPWTLWNDVRTYSSSLAFVASVLALVVLV